MKAQVAAERIADAILVVRGCRVILDADLAILYGVPTKALLQAVRRNAERFPEDFMFQLSNQEVRDLRSPFVTSSWGGRRTTPCVFTEQGVAMLSSVLRTPRAIAVNIEKKYFSTRARDRRSRSPPRRARAGGSSPPPARPSPR